MSVEYMKKRKEKMWSLLYEKFRFFEKAMKLKGYGAL